jgi:hypothetical protein
VDAHGRRLCCSPAISDQHQTGAELDRSGPIAGGAALDPVRSTTELMLPLSADHQALKGTYHLPRMHRLDKDRVNDAAGRAGLRAPGDEKGGHAADTASYALDRLGTRAVQQAHISSSAALAGP